MRAHRARLFDAIAALLVDLHRNGFYWGDCSLANTLFMRDGQLIRAWLVDAETAEWHPTLSDGQRDLDLDIMVENVARWPARRGRPAGGARRGRRPDGGRGRGRRRRYDALWDVLHEEPVIGLDERYHVEARVRRLNELGFAVDEVRLETAGVGRRAGPADGRRRRPHVPRRAAARRSPAWTSARARPRSCLNDLRSHVGRLQRESATTCAEDVAAQRWLHDVFRPGVAEAHEAVRRVGDPTQAYCDLLEVRWLLSEEAGTDVGDEPALAALGPPRPRRRSPPPTSPSSTSPPGSCRRSGRTEIDRRQRHI